jgi:drug/metabolite transporter (DMT)-like permease
MSRRNAIASLATACLIWALTFPLIKAVLPSISPLAFNALRFVLATPFLLPGLRTARRGEWLAGGLIGIFLSVGFAVQTIGLQYTSSSRSAFVTSLYVPLTPLVAFLAYRARPAARELVGLLLAVLGLFLLTRPDRAVGGINTGDILTLGCALMFACQLVAVGRYAREFSLERLLAVQVAVAAAVSVLLVPAFESVFMIPSPLLCFAIAFEVFAATVLALRLQLRGQQELSETESAIIFAMEPLVAALASMLALGERMSAGQWAGGVLILAGMLAPEAGRRVTVSARANEKR